MTKLFESNLDDVADGARKRAYMDLLLVLVFIVLGFAEFLEGETMSMVTGAVWVAVGLGWVWIARMDLEQERLLRQQHEQLESAEIEIDVVPIREEPDNGA